MMASDDASQLLLVSESPGMTPGHQYLQQEQQYCQLNTKNHSNYHDSGNDGVCLMTSRNTMCAG